MDLNDLRTLITALSFVVFVGIVYWAYSGRQRARFEEAAHLPFADGEMPGDDFAGLPLNSKANSTGVRS